MGPDPKKVFGQKSLLPLASDSSYGYDIEVTSQSARPSSSGSGSSTIRDLDITVCYFLPQ